MDILLVIIIAILSSILVGFIGVLSEIILTNIFSHLMKIKTENETDFKKKYDSHRYDKLEKSNAISNQLKQSKLRELNPRKSRKSKIDLPYFLIDIIERIRYFIEDTIDSIRYFIGDIIDNIRYFRLSKFSIIAITNSLNGKSFYSLLLLFIGIGFLLYALNSGLLTGEMVFIIAIIICSIIFLYSSKFK